MQKPRALLFFIASIVWFAIPIIAAAQGLVPCDGLSCNLCDLGILMQKIINFLIALTIPIAAVLFAYAGVLYTTAGGSPERINRAHRIFRNVLIGFLIAISAWLVVQTLLSVVFDKDFWIGGNWNELRCISESSPYQGENKRLIGTNFGDLLDLILPDAPGAPGPNFEQTYGTETVGGTVGLRQDLSNALSCASCENISASFQTTNNSKVTSSYNQFLSNFETQLSGQGLSSNNIAITEAWPPTTMHKAGCHYLGTCTDAGLRGVSYTNTSVSKVQAAATAAGGCAVFETNSQAACQGINNCKVYSHVTAPHFSLYGSASCR
jgi:hypothetical protein